MSKALPVSELLPIFDLIDGYILLRDGGVTAIAEVLAAPNVFSADTDSTNSIAGGFQQILNNLNYGDTLQLFCISSKLNSKKIIDSYNANITNPDEFWNKDYPEVHRLWLNELIIKENMPQYSYYVIYTYKYPNKNMPSDKVKIKEDIGMKFAIIAENFSRQGIELNTNLEKETIKELLNTLMNPTGSSINNDLFNNAPVVADSIDTKLTKQELLARTAFYNGFDCCRHGKQFCKTIYIYDLYDTQETNLFLSKLYLQGTYFQLSVFCHGVNQGEVLNNLTRQRKQSHAGSNAGTLGNMQSQEIFNQTDEVLRAYTRGEIRFIRYNIYITFYADSIDDLNRTVDIFVSQFSDLPIIKGEYEQEQLFKSHLPLARDLKRGTLVTTHQLANAYPFFFNDLGTKEGIIEGTSVTREVVKINPWSNELSNANQTVMGIAGSGKSFYTNLFLFRMLPWNTEIMIVDRSKSYETLCKIAGGEYLYFDLESGKSINPFDCTEEEIDSVGEVGANKIDGLTGLFDVMLSEEGEVRLDNLSRAILQDAVQRTYKKFLKDKKMPKLSSLADMLLEMCKDENNKDWVQQLKLLNKKLQPFIGDGIYAPLVDRETNININTSFVVFDTSNLRQDESVQSIATYIISNFLLKRVLENKKANKKQVLAIDEAWYLVRFQAGANFLQNLSKRSRHMGLACIFCTQQIGDFLNNEIAVTVIKNSPTITLFKQSSADLDTIKDVLALNDYEAGMIKGLGQKRYHYSQAFQIIGNNRGLVNITGDPLLYWTATTEPHKDVPLRNKKIEENNGDIKAAVWQLAEGGN